MNYRILGTALVLLAAFVVVAPLCGGGLTVTFSYHNTTASPVKFSSRMGTTGVMLDPSVTVPADTTIATEPHAVEKDYWFTARVTDTTGTALDSVTVVGYVWKTGSSVGYVWDGTRLNAYVFIPTGQ